MESEKMIQMNPFCYLNLVIRIYHEIPSGIGKRLKLAEFADFKHENNYV